MSADRWQHCPRCLRDARVKLAGERKMLFERYGKVPPEEWEQLLQGYKILDAEPQGQTATSLREDFWVGIDPDTGLFSVDYLGKCSRCGFEFAFTTAREVFPVGGGA